MSKKLVGIGAGMAVVAVAGTLAYRQYGNRGAESATAAPPPEAGARVITLGAEAPAPVAPGRVVITPVTPKQMPPKAADTKAKPAATQPAPAEPPPAPAKSAPAVTVQPSAPQQTAKPQGKPAQAAEAKRQAKPASTQPSTTQPKKTKVISLQGTPQASGSTGGKLSDTERASLALVQQLHQLRTSIQAWQAAHNGQPVDFIANPMWEQFIRRDQNGQPAVAAPVNPFNGFTRVIPVRDDPRPGQGVQGPIGYVYAVGSGKLFATDANGRIFDEGSVDALALQVRIAREMSPKDAERSVLATLDAMRSQVALFASHHNGTLPDFARYPAFEQFLKPTQPDGKVVESGFSGQAFGPYIRSMPINPLNGRYKVKAVAGEVRPGQRIEANDAGWVFSTATRKFYATDANGSVLDDVKSNATFIPADAGGTAKASGKPAEALAALRSKIEQYQLQHNGKVPDLKKYPRWEQLTSKTRVDGKVDPAGEYGPYLFQAPVNPVNGSSDVEVVQRMTKTYKPKKPVGYVFESSTGQVFLTNEHGMLASVE